MGIVVLVPCTNLHVHSLILTASAFLDVFVSIYCKTCNKDPLVKGESVDMWIPGSCRALIQWGRPQKEPVQTFCT